MNNLDLPENFYSKKELEFAKICWFCKNKILFDEFTSSDGTVVANCNCNCEKQFHIEFIDGSIHTIDYLYVDVDDKLYQFFLDVNCNKIQIFFIPENSLPAKLDFVLEKENIEIGIDAFDQNIKEVEKIFNLRTFL